MFPRTPIVKLLVIFAISILPFSISAIGRYEFMQKPVDPAAWGGNPVGKPIPEYVHGDECLFCHRNDIGGTWQDNAHGVTIRQKEDAAELTKLMSNQAPYTAQAD